MASFSQHGSGWRAQVYVAGERDSKVFRTKREAQAWASAREIELRQRRTQSPAETRTVANMLDRYSEEISTKKRGSRPEQLRIAAFLRDFPDLSAKTLASVQTPDLVGWRETRLRGYIGADGRQVRAAAPASVLRDINWLRNAFIIARDEWHWIEHNPFKGFQMPTEGPPRSRRVLPREVKLLCRRLGYRTGQPPTTKSQEIALAFLVALRSAMRVGEILSLGKDTLNLGRRVATVNHKMQYLTGRPREVPLSRHAIRLLTPVANRAQCFTVSSSTLDTLFRKARDQLMIEDLHFHDSRAEALTRLARKVDVMTLAKISGHSDLRLLQEVYYRESMEDIAARL
ncbi:tyrosine-type recombinase/integrase [Ralstonia solanacearum]|uniref:tyrosine-type recombinase/integrase n=1 Tax=Ralstonia solanacearum TaxID=305 RepID=UPI0001D9472A|nr:tyrosine-type recombinase/integrase [Ralstonia solanacearum]MBB6591524.1 tyrosine-type recombinase/integrase [Ralstonia solanacearum]MBB6595747.1 tyrosine-type recombinase/integrase [Ralstonia solanacearum]MDB0541974.1 tyrosine-type recombinase/integrase [Ralstonia solanacearum]MDB0550486.1 tyrosine-type recombinase/integrase [Ralstonia solanacearum]MDB0556876.1 tyrosine-type recombinase/integrase [Ralstonia solanacearum]